MVVHIWSSCFACMRRSDNLNGTPRSQGGPHQVMARPGRDLQSGTFARTHSFGAKQRCCELRRWRVACSVHEQRGVRGLVTSPIHLGCKTWCDECTDVRGFLAHVGGVCEYSGALLNFSHDAWWCETPRTEARARAQSSIERTLAISFGTKQSLHPILHFLPLVGQTPG